MNNLNLKNPYVLAIIGLISSTISPPSKLNKLYNDNRLFRLLYCIILCYALFNLNVIYSLIISLPLVFFLISVSLSSNIILDNYGKFLISTFIIFASILSAIFSSAISNVMYNTFFPCARQLDAT